MNDKVALVRGFIWASELTNGELERAAQGISERTYARGAYVCHRGDQLSHWGGIVEGLIKMSTIGRSGKAVTFAGLGNGAWFGEGSVIKNEPRKYDLVTLRETRLALMNRQTFMWLYENSIGFGFQVLYFLIACFIRFQLVGIGTPGRPANAIIHIILLKQVAHLVHHY